MARALLGLILLLVVFTLAVVLMRGTDAGPPVLSGALGHHVLDVTGDGGGFQDGAVVFASFGEDRITIEQLPSLEGRLRGTETSSGFLIDELTWYGVSLREAIGHCLDVEPRRVSGDPRLDAIWLDVNAARAHGPTAQAFVGWPAFKREVLSGLEQAYAITVVEGSPPGAADLVVVEGVPRSPQERGGLEPVSGMLSPTADRPAPGR